MLSRAVACLIVSAWSSVVGAQPDEPGGFKPPERKETLPPPPTPASLPTPAPAPAQGLSPAAPKSEDPRLAPWIVLGIGVTALVLGVYFVTETSAALDELAASPLRPDELSKRQTKVMTTGLGASVLLSAGTAGVVSGLALLTF
ncbi:MAG: hypothetical protein HY791_11455 [Deltaproteobacteria bacterium]|nr:hypothetical protein [Deltaproteobacteria bacterium]